MKKYLRMLFGLSCAVIFAWCLYNVKLSTDAAEEKNKLKESGNPSVNSIVAALNEAIDNNYDTNNLRVVSTKNETAQSTSSSDTAVVVYSPAPVQSETKNTTKKTTLRGTPINEDFDDSNVTMVSTPGSTCFSEVGYDEAENTLVVTFRDSGSTYAYYDVSSSVWSEFIAAESKGSYYNKKIKGNYDCEKIE